MGSRKSGLSPQYLILAFQGGTSVVVPYCYLFLLSVFIIWFAYYVRDIFWKELFIRVTVHVFRKLLSIYVFCYFPFDFEGRIWDLIVSVPDHCLFFTIYILIHALYLNTDF